MKIFLDTNVLVSSFAFEGLTRRLVAELVANHELYISPQVLDELRRTLIGKIYLSPALVETFIKQISEVAAIVEPPYEHTFAVRDRDDTPILSAALKSGAPILLTGDKDLLELTGPPIQILTPRTLYDRLGLK